MEKKKVEEANTYKEMEQVGKIVRISSNHFYFLHLITGCCLAGKGVGKPEAFW